MKWKLWPVYSWASWNPECHLLATACNDMLSSRYGRPLLPTLPQWICIFSQELSKPSCFPCISQFLEHGSALITVIWMKTRCVYIWMDGWTPLFLMKIKGWIFALFVLQFSRMNEYLSLVETLCYDIILWWTMCICTRVKWPGQAGGYPEVNANHKKHRQLCRFLSHVFSRHLGRDRPSALPHFSPAGLAQRESDVRFWKDKVTILPDVSWPITNPTLEIGKVFFEPWLSARLMVKCPSERVHRRCAWQVSRQLCFRRCQQELWAAQRRQACARGGLTGGRRLGSLPRWPWTRQLVLDHTQAMRTL